MVVAAALLIGAFPAPAWPAAAGPVPISVSQLLSDPGAYDGHTIVLEGECIGSIMLRGSFAWLSVNDGSSSVGVAAPITMVGAVKTLGNWKQTGDRVRITGVVLVASEAYGGETLVEASALEVIGKGALRQHPVAAGRAALAMGSVLLAIVTGLVASRRYRWL